MDSYLHINATIGIPLSIDRRAAHCKNEDCKEETQSSLRVLQNLLMANYLATGEEPEEAKAHVARVTRETEQIASYLVQAPRVSLRPVVMAEAARMSGDEYAHAVYLLAAGPGVRLTLPVPAIRMEAGFMYSSAYQNRWTLVMRFRLDSLWNVAPGGKRAIN